MEKTCTNYLMQYFKALEDYLFFVLAYVVPGGAANDEAGKRQ